MNRSLKRCMLKGASALMVLTVATACAETPQEGEVKKLIEQNIGEGAKIDEVKQTPYAGLYEVRTGGSVIYTDAKAQYIFAGQIFDAKTKHNYTKERIDELNKIQFSDLPLNLAMKTVKGNGSRTIAVFSDPNCGYCKRFEQTLKEVDNITVYTFIFPILSQDSASKAKNIWCAADKNKAWQAWMVDGKPAANAKADCASPEAQVFELGRKLQVSGTPTIFFTDGSRVPGAIDAKMLEQKLSTIK
ncbi:MAG: thiol:disulfide interchange protein [Burkholderiaceae bacterium]|nr:thiol:disulfide interchange protein [Burkholderiaceae bacterium]